MTEKILYFDCSFGISGDMTLGALVDAGADFNEMKKMLSALNLHGFELKHSKVMRSGISASKVDVIIEEHHDVHRHLRHIVEIIEKAELPEIIKRNAIKAFTFIAEAEAKVHGTTIEKVHFHEVGCLDAIADVTGSFIGLYLLKPDKIYASDITVGSGFVQTHHGRMPVPAPATAEILKDVQCRSGNIEGEQTTPTGAAILKTCVDKFIPMPSLNIKSIGYGAGTREIPGLPNVLRVLIGETKDSEFSFPLEEQTLLKLTTEIDDMNPEMYTKIFEDLFNIGCLDVFTSPIVMKKNRPGQSLQALFTEDKKSVVVEYMLKNTSTFGVKIEKVSRFCLKREFDTVVTKYGEVKVKVGFIDEKNKKIKPEFDSCLDLSKRTGIPLNQIYQSTISEIEKKFNK